MMPFLYGIEQHQETRRQAFDKFLQRRRFLIDQECTRMTEALATDIVKTTVTTELAEHILKSG